MLDLKPVNFSTRNLDAPVMKSDAWISPSASVQRCDRLLRFSLSLFVSGASEFWRWSGGVSAIIFFPVGLGGGMRPAGWAERCQSQRACETPSNAPSVPACAVSSASVVSSAPCRRGWSSRVSSRCRAVPGFRLSESSALRARASWGSAGVCMQTRPSAVRKCPCV